MGGLKKVEKDVKSKKHSKLLDSDSEDEKIPKKKEKSKSALNTVEVNPADFFSKKEATPRTSPEEKKNKPEKENKSQYFNKNEKENKKEEKINKEKEVKEEHKKDNE